MLKGWMMYRRNAQCTTKREENVTTYGISIQKCFTDSSLGISEYFFI